MSWSGGRRVQTWLVSVAQLVVGAVLVDDLAHPTRILAAHRSSGSPEVLGRWEFPGGKVEEGESPAEGLQRELVEELSIDVTIGPEVGDGTGWAINDRFVLRLFLGQVVSGRPAPGSDHDAVRWLGPDELDAVDWLASDREALPLVRDLLA